MLYQIKYIVLQLVIKTDSTGQSGPFKRTNFYKLAYRKALDNLKDVANELCLCDYLGTAVMKGIVGC